MKYAAFLEEISRKHLKPAYDAGVQAARDGVSRDAPHHAKTGGLVSVAFINGHMDAVAAMHLAKRAA